MNEKNDNFALDRLDLYILENANNVCIRVTRYKTVSYVSMTILFSNNPSGEVLSFLNRVSTLPGLNLQWRSKEACQVKWIFNIRLPNDARQLSMIVKEELQSYGLKVLLSEQLHPA